MIKLYDRVNRDYVSIDLMSDDIKSIEPKWIFSRLSQIYRCAGTSPLSVGQHSLQVMALAEDRGADTPTLLGCLLHDATEAFYGDIPGPLKTSDLRAAENELLLRLLQDVFGVDPKHINFTLVKMCDQMAFRLFDERLDLVPIMQAEDVLLQMTQKYEELMLTDQNLRANIDL